MRAARACFDGLSSQDALASSQAQAGYNLAVAQQFAAQNDFAIKRTALQLIIGVQPGSSAAHD